MSNAMIGEGSTASEACSVSQLRLSCPARKHEEWCVCGMPRYGERRKEQQSGVWKEAFDASAARTTRTIIVRTVDMQCADTAWSFRLQRYVIQSLCGHSVDGSSNILCKSRHTWYSILQPPSPILSTCHVSV
ncbi:hypothetical protein V2G26_015260 [Clonostachys chloroleuca]